jgi:hypothetical protein
MTPALESRLNEVMAWSPVCKQPHSASTIDNRAITARDAPAVLPLVASGDLGGS